MEYNGEVVLGVIYNPSLDELFAVEKGGGASLNGKPIRISTIDNLKKSLLVTGFAYDVRETEQDNLNHFYKHSSTTHLNGFITHYQRTAAYQKFSFYIQTVFR